MTPREKALQDFDFLLNEMSRYGMKGYKEIDTIRAALSEPTDEEKKAALDDLEYCLEQLDEHRLTRIALSVKDHWNTIRSCLTQRDPAKELAACFEVHVNGALVCLDEKKAKRLVRQYRGEE